MKADTGFRARHAKSFERVAVVTDEDWMKPALRALSFLMPGSARAFAVHDLAAAKAWLAKGSRRRHEPQRSLQRAAVARDLDAGEIVTDAAAAGARPEEGAGNLAAVAAAGGGDVRARRRHVADERVDLGGRQRSRHDGQRASSPRSRSRRWSPPRSS